MVLWTIGSGHPALLQFGSSVSTLGDFFAQKAGFSNVLMGISNQSAARGLNPGYAMGELVVTNQSPEDLEVSSDKIYVFERASGRPKASGRHRDCYGGKHGFACAIASQEFGDPQCGHFNGESK